MDGKDNICCLDISDASDDNGNLTDNAKAILKFMTGTYCEKSINGKDIHLLGKTEWMDVRSFSKDNTCKFYQKNHFVTLTGDLADEAKSVKSFDTYMRNFIESKFEKRTELECGLGKNSLIFNDREIYERAVNAKNGERIKQLFEDENPSDNFYNSILWLAYYLNLWCKGNTEQALRLLVASGLYRCDKSIEYYERIIISSFKIIKHTER